MGITIGLSLISAGIRPKAASDTDFIDSIKPTVVRISQKHHLYASVMMAQAILESDFGKSQLAMQANNYFGVKGTYHGNAVRMVTGEYTTNSKHYMTNATFKKYPNVAASIEDNALLLRNGLNNDHDYYKAVWPENALSASDAASELSKKYATDMSYGNKLIKIINNYHLRDLDTGSAASNINSQIESKVAQRLNDHLNSSVKETPSDKVAVADKPMVKGYQFDDNQKITTIMDIKPVI